MSKCSCSKNYCFYNSIKYAFNDRNPSHDFFANPNTMKRFLKISDCDQIEMHHLPLLEPKIRISISVVGDYEYTSENKYPKRITLEYKKGHYSLKSKKQAIQKIYPANLGMTTYFQLNDHFLTYDGNEVFADYTLKETDLRTPKSFFYKKFQKSELTHEEKKTLKKLEDTEEYEEQLAEYMVAQHDTYLKNIKHLKELTGIDISANAYSIKQTSLNLASKYLKAYQFQELDERETEWYQNTKCHGLMYCAEPTIIKGRCIDANSFYPSIMSSNKFIVPLGNPTYITLDKLPEIVSFGIYRAKITNYDKRLFAGNDKHYFTYTDIKLAVKRGYTIELIQDGEPNFLHYDSSNRETLFNLFKGYVDMLYPYKKKNPLVKKMLNVLWGAFCQKKKQYADGEVVLDDLDDLDSFVDMGEDDNDCFLIKMREYVYPTARIGVFITAIGRSLISEYVEDIVDDIYRIHTDGFITTTSKEFKFSDELGQYKLEHEGTYKIINLNNIEKL